LRYHRNAEEEEWNPGINSVHGRGVAGGIEAAIDRQTALLLIYYITSWVQFLYHTTRLISRTAVKDIFGPG